MSVDWSGLKSHLKKPDSLITNISDYPDYFHDATDYHAEPSAILLAENESDIVSAIKFCHENRCPITTRGAGTGLSGGCVPTPHSLLISTAKLKKCEIHPREKIALCGSGVITRDLQKAAEAYNLTYPPDPASYEESSLGGNIAENAGGLRCLRFGVTKDYVLGLKAVTAEGELLETGWYRQNRGFCLSDVLVGSEGTLAVVLEIAVRLIPVTKPGITLLAAFNKPAEAAATVSDVISSGMVPNIMEFVDGDAIACVNEYEKAEGLDEAAALLLIETSDKNPEQQAERIEEICRQNNTTELRIEPDPAKADHLWQVRRNVSRATKELFKFKFSEDVAVPISRFPTLVDFVSRMNRDSRLRINSYGHAGDGNLHVNFMSQTGSEEDLKLIEDEVTRLIEKAVELGGTITGEHGIGLAKRQYLKLEFDAPTLRIMHKIKGIFDPHGLLNPDKIFLPANNHV